MEVVWDIEATLQLQEYYEYLMERSELAAENVKVVILAEARALSEYAEKHPLDRFKIKNDDNYRAFEKYNV